jgi:NAD(P)-dependent dehydrogenase (short-subunit alcohol dehydrogenase family)
MASVGGAGESVAVVVGASELGSATATLLAGAGFTVVAADARPGTDPAAGAAYGRSKAALSHLVRVLSRERRPRGIRVNAAGPQLLDTSKTGRVFPAEVLAHAVRPEAAADIIAFLVSDRAAPVSGTVMPAYGA